MLYYTVMQNIIISITTDILYASIYSNISYITLSLIPIPPQSGAILISSLLNKRYNYRYMKYANMLYGSHFLVFILLVEVLHFDTVIASIINGILELSSNITPLMYSTVINIICLANTLISSTISFNTSLALETTLLHLF